MFKYLKSLGKHLAKRENVPEIQAAKQFDDEGFENSERPESSPNIVFVDDKRNLLDNLLNEKSFITKNSTALKKIAKYEPLEYVTKTRNIETRQDTR